jgi:hypothetical protein
MHVLVEDQGDLVLLHAGIRQRAAARLRAARLDRELAAGRAPVTDPLLAIRALRLCEEAYQRDLARNLMKLSRRRRSVTALAGMLSGSAPAGAVALANCLLADGSGPLYHPGRERDLDAVITRVLMAVDDSSTAVERGR